MSDDEAHPAKCAQVLQEDRLEPSSIILPSAAACLARNYSLLADHGTRFEHECYDIGHLYNLAHFVDKGIAKPAFFIQSVFGILGGIGADPDNVVFMRRTADRLFVGADDTGGKSTCSNAVLKGV